MSDGLPFIPQRGGGSGLITLYITLPHSYFRRGDGFALKNTLLTLK